VIKTVEAVIDEHGRVSLLESVELPEVRRALVTILEEGPALQVPETALLSEPALAEDWNRPEEDAAWSHLQSARRTCSVSFGPHRCLSKDCGFSVVPAVRRPFSG
jgi:hypothetical protein